MNGANVGHNKYDSVEGAQCQVKVQYDEVSLVAETNARSGEIAVMITLQYTHAAHLAVVSSGRNGYLAGRTGEHVFHWDDGQLVTGQLRAGKAALDASNGNLRHVLHRAQTPVNDELGKDEPDKTLEQQALEKRHSRLHFRQVNEQSREDEAYANEPKEGYCQAIGYARLRLKYLVPCIPVIAPFLTQTYLLGRIHDDYEIPNIIYV